MSLKFAIKGIYATSGTLYDEIRGTVGMVVVAPSVL